MELSQLRSFMALAEAGSVTGAAERLCLTQPAVTQQLRALERELGVLLFDRMPRGIVLTRAGTIFQEYVARGLCSIDTGRRAAIEIEGGDAGSLLIGAGVTTSVTYLPEWLRRYQREYPNVDVVVRTVRSAEVARMVMSREIDIGIVTSRQELEGLAYTPLVQEEIVLVRARRGKPSTITLGELSELPIIVFPQGTGFRDFLDNALAKQGIGIHIKMETDSVEAIKSFVAVGLGASFLPARSVDQETADASPQPFPWKGEGGLERVRVDGLLPIRRETAVVYRAAGHMNAAAKGFLHLLTSE